MANNTDWLNISQMTGGTGETALSLTALTNSSLQPKTATITARNTQYNVSDTTTVTIQGFQPTLTLSRSTLRFDSTGGTATFTVYSNTAWTINFPALVHSYSTSAGTGDTEVTVVLAPNTDLVSKVEVGTVQDIFGVNQLYLTIVQESFIIELTVTPDDDIIFDNTGSTTSVTIDCNTDWEIECPDWVVPSVVSGGSGTTTVTFTANINGDTDRSGEIIVYAGSKSVTINAFQPFYVPDHITVTPTAYTFPYSASSTVFVVDSYPEWSIVEITTAQTTWGENLAATIKMTIPDSAAPYTMNFGQTGVIINGVVTNTSTYTFSTGGDYTLEYPFATTTMPVVSGNPYIAEVIIGDAVETVPAGAFAYCTALSSITIPSGITEIGAGCFSGCSNLQVINSDATTAPTVTANTFRGIPTGGTLNYPANSDYSTWLSPAEYYLGYYFWNGIDLSRLYKVATLTYDVVTTSKATKILQNASGILGVLYDGDFIMLNGSQTDFTFSSTGKQSLDFYCRPIGDYSDSFNSAHSYTIQISGLTNITDAILHQLPLNNEYDNKPNYTNFVTHSGNNITALTVNCNTRFALNIGQFKKVKIMVLGGYSKLIPTTGSGYNVVLTDLTISSNQITEISDSAFRSCSTLSALSITGPVTSIGDYAFHSCTALKEIVFPNNVRIGSYAFFGCTNIKSLNLTNTTVYLGSYAFENTGIETLVIGSGVTWNGVCSFRNTPITSVTFEDGLTSVGGDNNGVFSVCTRLSSITVPNSVQTIGPSSFCGCTALSSATLGTGLTLLSGYAFKNCSSLSSITSYATIAPTIGANHSYAVFLGVANNGTLYCPSGSDYSGWFSGRGNRDGYLGYYNWTTVEI